MTSVTDIFPTVLRRGLRREMLLLGICLFCYLMSLFMITEVYHFYIVFYIMKPVNMLFLEGISDPAEVFVAHGFAFCSFEYHCFIF